MQKQSVLKQQAIRAAKEQNWQQALELNSEILEENPKDLEALNRLGLASMQLGDIAKAKNTFKKVISLDKSNIIANKNLLKIKNKQTLPSVSFSDNCNFIEEPGKTKIIELHRLAGKQVLSLLCIGQPCQLILKNRYISVSLSDGQHVGALPEDISFRLTKLIKRGNEYSCSIHSCNGKKCCVHIKETKTSKKNAHLQSFPTTKFAMANLSQLGDDIVMEEFIPVESIDGDEDENPQIQDALEKIHQD